MENEHEIEFLRNGKTCKTKNAGYYCSHDCQNLIDRLKDSTNSRKRFYRANRFECDLEKYPDKRLMNECGEPVTNFQCSRLTKLKIKESQVI